MLNLSSDIKIDNGRFSRSSCGVLTSSRIGRQRLTSPLYRAADAGMLLLWRAACLRHLHHGLEELTARVRRGCLFAAGVKTSTVLQLKRRVIAEEVRCTHGAVGFRHL